MILGIFSNLNSFFLWILMHFMEFLRILTLSHPGFWILVITRGVFYWHFLLPPSINVDLHIDLRCFSFIGGKNDKFWKWFFSELKTLISRSNLIILCSSCLNIHIFKVEKYSVIKKWVYSQKKCQNLWSNIF